MSLPKALVLSDLPIVGAAIGGVLHGQYDVTMTTWRNYIRAPLTDPALVVLDVTAIGRDSGLALLARLVRNAVVVVSTLHSNEVELLRLECGVFGEPHVLPSLLSLPHVQIAQPA